MGGGRRTPTPPPESVRDPPDAESGSETEATGAADADAEGDSEAAAGGDAGNAGADPGGNEAGERYITPSASSRSLLDSLVAAMKGGGSETEDDDAEDEDDADRDAEDEDDAESASPVDDPVTSGRYADFGVDPDADATTKARHYLSSRAIAPRHSRRGTAPDGDEGGRRAIPPAESRPDRFGGWDEYEETEPGSPLGETGEELGRTAGHMDTVRLDDETAADSTGDRAFVTRYDSPDGPAAWNAQSEMATYAFCDAVGIDVPRHTYNAEEEWVASEEVPGTSAANIDAESFPRGKVDRDEYLDQVAVQLLAGNTDLTADNMKIDDEGRLHYFDFDYSRYEYANHGDLRGWADLTQRTNEILADLNEPGPDTDADFEVSNDEFAERAKEIAVKIHNSGDTDRVVEAAAAYEPLFEDTNRSPSEQIRNNIEVCVEAARDEADTAS